MEAEDPAKKNWAEEVDEDEDEAANQTIGNVEAPKPEEEKKSEPAKVYNLAPRERNAYGDFIVKKVVIKEKEAGKNADAEDDDDEDEDESDEEDDNDQL